MIEGNVVSMNDDGMRVEATFAGSNGVLFLQVGEDARILSRVSGMGIAATTEIIAEPDRSGAWKLNGHLRLPDAIVALVHLWVRNFALARLDDISHSLTGDRRARLDIMERLHATMTDQCGVPQHAAGAAIGSSGLLPSPILVRTPQGPLVVSFGSDRLADVSIPDPENACLAMGSVRFNKNPDGRWLPAPIEQWDLFRCRGQLRIDASEMVRSIMQPIVAGAARLHEQQMAERPSVRNLRADEPAAIGTIAALSRDIESLRTALAVERPGDARTYGAPRSFGHRGRLRAA